MGLLFPDLRAHSPFVSFPALSISNDRMISLCTSWALFSLSIVALMVYLPVEISTAVLSFYLYNMVPYHVVGVVFLTQSPSFNANLTNEMGRLE